MKTSMILANYCQALGRVVLGVVAFEAVALAAPVQKDISKKMEGVRPAGPMGVSVERLDDATLARGGSATGGSAEALIFDQPNDSGFGWFMKQDDVFGYGTWASQAVFANGWAPGDSISSYTMRFFHSTSDDESYGDGTISTELWNGDPFSIMETPCSAGNGGVNTPIAGTQATFSGLAYGSVNDLTAVLANKVVVDCDRVWIAATWVTGCRGAWRIEGTDGSTWNAPASVGSNNGVWLLWACEQFGGCPTATGYNSGTCCAFGGGDPNEVCNHAIPDISGDPIDPCSTGAAAGITFCGDGAADYFVANINEPGLFRGLVSSVSATTDTVMSVVPVSVDALPGSGSAAGVISLGGDEVVLQDGDHNVWLEFRVGDWDPDDTGRQLAAWVFGFDSSGYTSGDQGTIEPYTAGGAGTCVTDEDCEPLLGPGARCDPPGYHLTFELGPGVCSYAFIDAGRPDFVYAPELGTSGPIFVVDLGTPNIRAAATVIVRGPDDPEPYPEEGLYGATLTLHVPADAKGTFTVGLFPFPRTSLVDQDSQFVPLLGITPAKITVETGRCCFNLQEFSLGDRGCLDQLMTEATCAQMPGVTLYSSSTEGLTCDDPCGCDPAEPSTFDDGDACTNDSCIDGSPVHVPGDATDGLACTIDSCDPLLGSVFTQACPGGDCTGGPCDDGLACTVDSCTEPNGCNNELPDIDDGDDCTIDQCNEPDGIVNHIDINQNIYPCPTGDPVADGCPAEAVACVGGWCVCGGVCGDGIVDTALGEECDGTAGACDLGACNDDCTCPEGIPTMSQWGMVIFALLLLVGAKGYFGRRERAVI